jgi:hypothetical protein
MPRSKGREYGSSSSPRPHAVTCAQAAPSSRSPASARSCCLPGRPGAVDRLHRSLTHAAQRVAAASPAVQTRSSALGCCPSSGHQFVHRSRVDWDGGPPRRSSTRQPGIEPHTARSAARDAIGVETRTSGCPRSAPSVVMRVVSAWATERGPITGGAALRSRDIQPGRCWRQMKHDRAGAADSGWRSGRRMRVTSRPSRRAC